ncbi:MAG: type II toxin-antitoxin system YoeB family toxin [Veillonellaceae bacterium]|nr:type II toxin-antitoxin system YoeB family toxin [Veillonellaceae bacterium]
MIKRINTLIKDIQRHSFTGLGKPKALRGGRH